MVCKYPGISSGNHHPHSVLIVEDDPPSRDILASCLRNAGLEVAAVGSLKAARHEVKWACPDLVVLDLGLPDGNGMDLMRELRTVKPAMGIILVTSQRRTSDILLGLETGADDYVCKPFAATEVVARVQAALRRLYPPSLPNKVPLGHRLLDLEARQLLKEDGSEVYLTQAEFDLLTHLLRSSGRVQTREQLLDAIDSRSDDVTDRKMKIK